MANYEQLFLLEVLVDRIKLLTRALEAFAPECEDEPETPVRIRVKFSDFPCFEITQDLAPVSKERNESDPLTTPILFCSGKSCMFPMDPEQLMQDLIKYPMAVTVFKKNPDSPIPEIIGQTKVPLGDYMSNIIKRASEWALEEPLSEMIQDTFPLRNAQDQDVGTITMLIRLTCFGKTIITKFQIADNKKSFLFKNSKTQDYEFKCKKCMPGQPILRPRDPYSEEEEEEEDDSGWHGEGMSGGLNGPLPCTDTQTPMESFQDPCIQKHSSPLPPLPQVPKKEGYSSGPGFQRHEFQGPGFTASMEVAYPEDGEENYRRPVSKEMEGLSESHSAPAVRKETTAKSKARGKSADPKKIDVSNGIKLPNTKRKKKTKFHVPQGIAYPGIILGHKYCVNQGPPVPAKNGWAWKTTVPAGMKWEDMRGWKPGAYLKQTWNTIKAVEELRKMGKRKKIKRRPLLPDTRKTTVHIHRIKGVYHVTMHPIKGPDDKEDPEPVVYTLERPEDGSDASELELDLTVPDPPYPPPPVLKHQAQQFCEEDLPLPQPKPVFIKKKKKKEKKLEETDSKKKKPGSAKSDKSKKSEKETTAKGKGSISGKGYTGKEFQKKGRRDSKSTVKGKPGAKDKKMPSGKAPAGKGAPAGRGAPLGRGTSLGGKAALSGKGGSTGKGAPSGKGGSMGKGASAGKGPPSRGKGAPQKGKGKDVKDSKGKPIKSDHDLGKKKKSKGKKKGDDEDDVFPWDEWIMKLKCKRKTQVPDD